MTSALTHSAQVRDCVARLKTNLAAWSERDD
jgi:hypothetical protein